eukprot:1433921-Rhodomonas_salina.1
MDVELCWVAESRQLMWGLALRMEVCERKKEGKMEEVWFKERGRGKEGENDASKGEQESERGEGEQVKAGLHSLLPASLNLRHFVQNLHPH